MRESNSIIATESVDSSHITISEALENKGIYRRWHVSSLDQIPDRLNQSKNNILFLDWNLVNSDTLDSYHEIIGQEYDVTQILLIDDHNRSKIEELEQAGVNGLIMKPIKRVRILDSVIEQTENGAKSFQVQI